MNTVVPRWEWRTAGPHLERLRPDLATRADRPPTTVTSEETYLLSATGRDLVKLRAGLMDVKHLLEVDAHGLERWTPVLKAPFPLAADDAVLVASALAIDAPPPAGPVESLGELLEDAWQKRPDVRAVSVVKHRERYVVAGCWAELTELRTDDATTLTLAVESEDPDRVVSLVAALGLLGVPNVNVGRILAVLTRFGATRVAVLDVGTNSVKFHVGERTADGSWHTVVDRAEVTRLGEGLRESGRLGARPVERTVAAVAHMVAEARGLGVAAVSAVGTAGLRIAPNRDDLLDAVLRRCGVTIEVISGEDEARLAYRAATADLTDRGSRVVFDTGGGSSQFTLGAGDRIDEQFSVDVGAARFTEAFGLHGPVDAGTLDDARAAIGEELAFLDGRDRPDVLVGMGGAVVNLAAVQHGLRTYDPDVIHGTTLRRDEIERQIAFYRTADAETRRAVPGLQPGRAEVILAGACIVAAVVDLLGHDALRVSDRGLRHGVLAERYR